MAQILLHGTLHATIFEADSLSNPRASGSAPKFIRKVSSSLVSSLLFSFLRNHPLYTRLRIAEIRRVTYTAHTCIPDCLYCR